MRRRTQLLVHNFDQPVQVQVQLKPGLSETLLVTSLCLSRKGVLALEGHAESSENFKTIMLDNKKIFITRAPSEIALAIKQLNDQLRKQQEQDAFNLVSHDTRAALVHGCPSRYTGSV